MSTQMGSSNNTSFDAFLEPVPCGICGATEYQSFLEALRLVTCARCGVVYARERLPLEKLKEYYSQEYYSKGESKETGYDDYFADRDVIKTTFAKRLREIERFTPGKGRSLDVGCAMGFFVETARERGWEAEGIDISEYSSKQARNNGLKVTHAVLGNFHAEPASFDLITLWDMIEHTPTPVEDLKKAHALLNCNGVLALATPDISSWAAKAFKEKWVNFKHYEHIYYFDAPTMTRILKNLGFKVLAVSHIGKYVTLDFFTRRLSQYEPFLHKIPQFLLSRKLVPNFKFYCNPKDILMVIARK